MHVWNRDESQAGGRETQALLSWSPVAPSTRTLHLFLWHLQMSLLQSFTNVGLQLPHRRWWKGNLKHQQFHLRLKVSSRKAHFSGFLLWEHQSIPASLGDTETHQQCWPAGSEHTFKMSSSNNINHNSGMLEPVLSTEKHFLFSHVPLQDRYQHLFLIKENSEAQSS